MDDFYIVTIIPEVGASASPHILTPSMLTEWMEAYNLQEGVTTRISSRIPVPTPAGGPVGNYFEVTISETREVLGKANIRAFYESLKR
jgi:hypothetical protein